MRERKKKGGNYTPNISKQIEKEEKADEKSH